MKVINPSFEIWQYDTHAMQNLEKIARTCYKSEDKIGEGTSDKLIERLIRNGHEAMIEHSSITVKFIHNRGFLAEITRHRLCSFAVESTRYCNYSKDKFDNQITFISPYWLNTITDGKDKENSVKNIRAAKKIWTEAMLKDETDYLMLINKCKLPPQAARGVLSNDLKTEIVITANMREWRTIFKLRTAQAAHPDMRRVMIPLLDDLKKIFPVLFGDLT